MFEWHPVELNGSVTAFNIYYTKFIYNVNHPNHTTVVEQKIRDKMSAVMHEMATKLNPKLHFAIVSLKHLFLML